MDILVQQIMNGLVLGSVYAIIALGYTMGESIKGVPPHLLLKRGLAMVPEGRGIFARMSIACSASSRV